MRQPVSRNGKLRAMRSRMPFGLLAAALLCAQVVGAQSSGSAPTSGIQPGISSEPDELPLSPEQQLQRAEAFLERIAIANGSVSRQLRAARKERDVVKVLCLNDKSSQISVAHNSAKDRLEALRTAVQRKDADRARHEFTVLDVLQDRVKTLIDESSQCVGEETGFTGDAEVSVTIDPNLPNDSSGGETSASAPPPPASTASGIE